MSSQGGKDLSADSVAIEKNIDPLDNGDNMFSCKTEVNSINSGSLRSETKSTVETNKGETNNLDELEGRKSENGSRDREGRANEVHRNRSNSSSRESETEAQWTFLDPVLDFMKCKICSCVFKSPHLLSCCGTNICKQCMDRHLQRIATLADQKPSCPFCRSTDFKMIHNAALELSINQLKVRCCYQHKGCGWTGVLQNGKLHLEECNFTPISCPNGCGCERFERQRLSDHTHICPNQHIDCSFKPVGCEMKLPLFRQAAQKHANDHLSQHLLLVAQRNVQLLSNYRHLYTSLQSQSSVSTYHNEVASSHSDALASTNHTITLLRENLQEIQQKTSSLKAELRREEICLLELKKKNTEAKNVEAMCRDGVTRIESFAVPEATGISCPPVTFTIDRFRDRMKLNDMWLSPPFYTHTGGYKMCLSVYPNNGHSNVSVHIHFLPGEFDDHLMWPFPGAIFTITAINQRNGKGNRNVHLELVGKDTLYHRAKPTNSDFGFYGFGVTDFLFHSNLSVFLSTDNCFKLMVYRIQFFPL